MNRNTQAALKSFCQGGGLSLLEEVIQEIKENREAVIFKGDTNKLLHEMGKREGMDEGYSILLETIINYAKE